VKEVEIHTRQHKRGGDWQHLLDGQDGDPAKALREWSRALSRDVAELAALADAVEVDQAAGLTPTGEGMAHCAFLHGVSAETAAVAEKILEPHGEFEVVVYEDIGEIQVWCGPAKDWPTHAAEHCIEEHQAEDHFTIIGRIKAETTELQWT
jgi:hypothetical protein